MTAIAAMLPPMVNCAALAIVGPPSRGVETATVNGSRPRPRGQRVREVKSRSAGAAGGSFPDAPADGVGAAAPLTDRRRDGRPAGTLPPDPRRGRAERR